MKNRYDTRGDVTVIYVKCKEEEYECLIDTEDLEKVSDSCSGNWHYSSNGRGKSYVDCVENGKTLKLHRLIMDAPKGLVVDHIQGNTLDNRKEKLRVVTQSENNQNSVMPKNNKSGVKGLSYSTRDRLWVGQIWHLGKCHRIGWWKRQEFKIAKAEMEKARKELHQYGHRIKEENKCI